MSTGQYAALASWKLRQKGRHLVGGLAYRGLQGRADRWAATSGSSPSAFRSPGAWLRRRGAGSFWLSPEEASDWARASFTPEDLAVADAAIAGVFELLGSGPIHLGDPPRWRQDLYSGYEWPLEPSHRIGIQRGDGSDIRTVWELSRSYHLLPLARAYWSTRETRYRDAFVRHVDSWIADNPLGKGPHWASPMDAGIRAANWIVALLLFADAEGIPAEFWRRISANLYATGLFLERHLEWHPVYRGNHFVSNGVGLVYLGTLLRDTRAGARWLRTGADILCKEILTQVHDDGVSFEASLAYHRLDTEFFAYGGELLRRNLPEGLPAPYEDRLRRMYRFIATYLPRGGEASMLGDADDGRLHSVSTRGWLEPRRHALGLPDGYWPEEPPSSAAFPEGGFFVLRHGEDHAIVRCGSVGLNGAGSHDHNDQLSFELVLGGRRVVADSGTYAYTRDLAARFAFRATAAHSVAQLGVEEQNPIRIDRPWRILADRTRSECLRWEPSSESILFEGRHFGYAHRPSGAVCRRRLATELPGGVWELRDEITGVGTEVLRWRLHLATEDIEWVTRDEESCELVLPGSPAIRIEVRMPSGLRVSAPRVPASDRYGERHERICLTVEGEVLLPFVIVTTFQVED
jgi:hypothetical protein